MSVPQRVVFTLNGRQLCSPGSGEYFWAALIFSISYGLLFAGFPLEEFKDRANYLRYASESEAVLARYWSRGILATLANEPLWLLINSFLASFLSPETVLRTLIFFPAAVSAWLVLRRQPEHFVWLIIILILPQVFKNYVIHLRQGVAISIFLLGWFSDRRVTKHLLLGLTPFVHSSFFFILMLLALSSVLLRVRLALDLRSLFIALVGLAVGLGLGWLAELFGARQSGSYGFSVGDVSGLGFIFWSVVLALFFFESTEVGRSKTFEIAILIFYLATYFFVEVAGRIFESGMLVVLLAGLALSSWRLIIFKSLLCLYVGMQMAIRFNLPGFGFAV